MPGLNVPGLNLPAEWFVLTFGAPMQPRALVLAFGVLLLVCISTSPPRRVGDGHEYVAMAMNLTAFRPPALAPADIVRIERELERWHFSGLPLAWYGELRDEAGRQDFFHFWFYSALAAPGVWFTGIAGLHPNYAFAGLNVVLLLSALFVVSRRLPWWLTAMVFCSPVLWWIDKAHTEVFTFSLLAIAFALLRDAPWWSMIALGAAATQNPPIAVVLALVAAAMLAVRPSLRRDARFWKGALVAAALALLHPAYYEWRWSLTTPQLLLGTAARVPTIQELGAVVWDPNLGVVFHAPLLAVTIAAAAVAVARLAWSRLIEPEVWLSVAAAAVFLFSFAQSTNMNNGATPGMSRYGVWLIPLAIPILLRAATVVPVRVQRWFVSVAMASCLSCIVGFEPRRPENYCAPTRLANFVWARWPSLDNPLPEIFSERLSASEPGLAPVATPGCTKVLLIGGGWPVPCRPEPVPAMCAPPDALCYANRGSGGFRFVPVPSPPRYTFERRRTWTWDAPAAGGIERVLSRVQGRDLRQVVRGTPGAMLRDADSVSWTYGLESEQELLVYVRQPRQGASVTLRLPTMMVGWLIDAQTGDQIQPLRIEGRPSEPSRLIIPPSRAVALVLRRAR